MKVLIYLGYQKEEFNKTSIEEGLGLGGSEIATASFIAGTVRVGPDLIGNTAGLPVEVPVKAVFEGPNSGVRGFYLAQTMFAKSFGDDRDDL